MAKKKKNVLWEQITTVFVISKAGVSCKFTFHDPILHCSKIWHFGADFEGTYDDHYDDDHHDDATDD